MCVHESRHKYPDFLKYSIKQYPQPEEDVGEDEAGKPPLAASAQCRPGRNGVFACYRPPVRVALLYCSLRILWFLL